MVKRKGRYNMLLQAIRPTRKKRIIQRKTNKMANMTKQDFKEMNEVSKRGRGLSKITLRDVFGDGN